MKEQDIIDLGFVRVDVTAGESGYPQDWYYYVYDFTNSFSLISCDNDEAQLNGWYIELFEDTKMRFTDTYDVQELIKIINRAIK